MWHRDLCPLILKSDRFLSLYMFFTQMTTQSSSLTWLPRTLPTICELNAYYL